MPRWRAASRTSSSGQPLDGERALDRLTVLDDHERDAVDERPDAAGAPRHVRQQGDPEGERRCGEDRAGERVVLLGDALLDDVAEGDQQEQLERREVGERAPLHPTGEEEQEDEHHRRAQDDLHYGSTLVWNSTDTTGSPSSSTATLPPRPDCAAGSMRAS